MAHEILLLFLHSRKMTEVTCISVFPLPQGEARLGWPQEGSLELCSVCRGQPKAGGGTSLSPPHPRLLFASTRLQHRPSFLHLCLHHCSISFFPVKHLGTLVAQATVTLQCEEPTEATTLELFYFSHLKKIPHEHHLKEQNLALPRGKLSYPRKESWISSYSCDSTYGF